MEKYRPFNIWLLVFTGLNIIFTLFHHYHYDKKTKKIQQRWNPKEVREPMPYTGPVFETAEDLQT